VSEDLRFLEEEATTAAVTSGGKGDSAPEGEGEFLALLPLPRSRSSREALELGERTDREALAPAAESTSGGPASVTAATALAKSSSSSSVAFESDKPRMLEPEWDERRRLVGRGEGSPASTGGGGGVASMYSIWRGADSK
jgi:hypothetical protein